MSTMFQEGCRPRTGVSVCRNGAAERGGGTGGAAERSSHPGRLRLPEARGPGRLRRPGAGTAQAAGG
ncbi:hypothetical protein, partial [Streptomyces clavuligerus]|uniref:hypothetical protein n=2 Tax=Streptomyces clavuligerus TaxID=1901 RepID=UPI001E2B0B8E